MRYNGYIPEHLQNRPPREQLADLQGRLLGDYCPQDFVDVNGALNELVRIIDNFMREQERATDGIRNAK